MAGVYKRGSDKERKKAGKWTAWWIDEHGKQKSKVAYTDKAKSLDLANEKETEARQIRDGMLDPADRTRKEAKAKTIAEHVEAYRLSLIAKNDSGDPRHASHVAGVIKRLMEDASIVSVAEIIPERIQASLGRLRVKKSPRTCNHALGAIKAFVRWLEANGRIKEAPKALLALKPYSEKVDRKRVRRALTIQEVDHLLAVTEAGLPVKLSRRGYQYEERWISGPERAALYRLAMGTGFRADELRTLTPERFALDGPEPTITVLACYSKNGDEAIQPIVRELAAAFKPFLEGKEPGKPVIEVPERTAQLLRHDLKAAGIPYADGNGRVVDFHALRATYITSLIRKGVNVKIVQKLARHSTITLTLDLYTHLDDDDLRKALEDE